MRRSVGLGAGLLLLVLPGMLAAQPARDSEDWADSPEAYFLTAQERAEWMALDSRDARGAFRDRYWLKRDPTAGTEKNEFRDLVLARIKTADQRFGIEKTPGSRTARGFVFIIFGTPARVQDEHAPAPEQPVFPATPSNPGTLGPLEGTETLSLWIYDPERTPRILEALERPRLEIEIIVEPNRHSDSIQNPGLVNELRERLAKKTIVNPDLIPPAEETAAAPAPMPPPRAALDAATKKVLQEAPFVSRTDDSAFGNAVLWRETGGAEALVWFHVPQSPKAEKRFLHGLVRQEDGREVASVSEPVAASPAFSATDAGETILKSLALPPGTYEAAFAVTEGSGSASRPVASASAKLAVPNLDSGFAVSSLLLTRGPGTRDPGDHSPFALGSALLPPRADATFAASESLWFFLELANAPDPSKATLEIRLRRGSDSMRGQPAMPANPQEFAAGRYLCGFELPLSGLEPGDYRLYVLVRDGASAPDKPVVRSADFRLRP